MLSLVTLCGRPDSPAAPLPPNGFWLTNGPLVYQASLKFVTNVVPRLVRHQPPPTNLPPEIREAMMYFRAGQQMGYQTMTETNLNFDHFLPNSLNYFIWTNVIANTNGRSTVIWSVRSHPPTWPAVAPDVKWNHSSLVWGMRGMTALSPCWEAEGSTGQLPITALTRRHGYTRGHHMGPTGFRATLAGKKVWFLTRDDRLVERRIVREVVRTIQDGERDYTIVLFNEDLPRGIQPIRVTIPTNIFTDGPSRYRFAYRVPAPLFMTEQSGQVSADIPGFTPDIRKGGDSGSPNMLPMPGELVFVNGRSTSGASPAMQADMDELCRLEGVNPARYQLQWVDLSRFPKY